MLRANGTKKRPAASRKTRSAGEILSVEQIVQRYDAEWVLLRDPVVAKGPRLIKGEVVAHSRNRDDIDRVALRLKLRSSASFFTGPINGDFIL